MDWALNKNSIAELNRLADYLKKYPFTLFISGHTDTDSTESYNQTLKNVQSRSKIISFLRDMMER